jgi:hypothetical protein
MAKKLALLCSRVCFRIFDLANLRSRSERGPMAGFRVFLSAVTSEFGAARDAVANDLQARGLELRVQRSFRQEPGADTLLGLLHDYIKECDAVVCVIGTRSGACPPAGAAAEFAHLLPAGITAASYTQWEFFFARAYQRRLSLYIAEADYRPDQDAPTGGDLPELQKAAVAHIKKAALHYGRRGAWSHSLHLAYIHHMVETGIQS